MPLNTILPHLAPAPPQALALVLPHLPNPFGKSAEAYLTPHTVSIGEIEHREIGHLLGLDLLLTLDDKDFKKAVASEL